jgi:tetratricopeptide (TPR) repeat protein
MIVSAFVLAAVVGTAPVTAHRPVSTSSPVAQARFDTALTELYAYAGGDAAIEFDAAALSDPHLAIAFWGKALAEGSDINTPLTEERFDRAAQAARAAVALKTYASPEERELIEAVAMRYTGSFTDRVRDESAYEDAMRAYVASHPSDDDAATLLVEASLERGGMHWNEDGTPLGASSAAMLASDSAVLARSPQHLLANHLCIHLYDNAPDRSPAVACAQRLDTMTFAPEDEHLAHMPAHTWIERGNGASADASSERAWQLHPQRYAEHDAYVGLLGAIYSGNTARISVWSNRYRPFGDPAAVLIAKGRPDTVAMAAAQRDEAAGKIDAAAANLRAAMSYQRSHFEGEIQPADPADNRLGALFYRAGRFSDAQAAFLDVLSRRPDDPRGLFGMSETLRRLGRADEAEAYATRARAGWAGLALTMTAF